MIDFSKIKSKKEVGKCFDYAILPKQTTEQTIRDCCKEAIKYNCKAFCFLSFNAPEESPAHAAGIV